MTAGAPLPATKGFIHNWDIHTSSKAGDLLRIKYLVEQLDQDVNEHDIHNSSPLFYACLCGHPEVVKYLLDCGSRLIPGLFETERCFYGALTDDIRDVLIKHKANPNKFDHLVQNMQGLRSMALHTDFVLNVEKLDPEEPVMKPFPTHRFILAARSPWFAERLEGMWKNEPDMHIPCGHRQLFPSTTVASAMIDFIYSSVIDIDEDEAEAMANVCRTLGFEEISGHIIVELKRKDRELRRIVLKNENERARLTKQMGRAFSYQSSLSTSPQPKSAAWHDICLELKDENEVTHRYACHRALLCQHSAYFHALISGHFREASELREHAQNELPTIEMENLSRADLFELAIRFLYTNTLEAELNEEDTVDLLTVCDQMLLMELKRLCAVRLRKFMERRNVFAFLRLGERVQIRLLRDACLDFVEHNILDLWNTPDFLEALKDVSPETAQELRFYVSERVPNATLPEDES